MARGYVEGRQRKRRSASRRKRRTAGAAGEDGRLRGGLRLDRGRSQPHFLGWRRDVDADELFASGKAWGVTVRRVAAATD